MCSLRVITLKSFKEEITLLKESHNIREEPSSKGDFYRISRSPAYFNLSILNLFIFNFVTL